MKKRFDSVFVSILGFVFSLNLISALSVAEIFDSVDSSTWVLGTLFIIIFFFVNFSLSKFTKGRGGAGSTVAALAFSLLAVYGIHKTGLDYGGFFYGSFDFLGIPEAVLYYIIPLIFLGLIIYGTAKMGLGLTLIATGGIIGVTGLLNLFEESGTVFAAGLILGIIGFIVLWLSKKKDPEVEAQKQAYKQQMRQQEYDEKLARRQQKVREKSAKRSGFFKRGATATGRNSGFFNNRFNKNSRNARKEAKRQKREERREDIERKAQAKRKYFEDAENREDIERQAQQKRDFFNSARNKWKERQDKKLAELQKQKSYFEREYEKIKNEPNSEKTLRQIEKMLKDINKKISRLSK